MNRTSLRFHGGITTHIFLSAVLVLAFSVILTQPAAAQILLNQISTDTFTNGSSQHVTEVEPDTFAFGSTMVAAFQMGRFVVGGGSSDIGFSTSTDGGASWTNGTLPGITTFVGGPFSRASDPSVAFDSAHGVWMIASLGIASSNSVLVSTSSDGINWNNPVVVNSNTGFADKTWMVCDNSPSSAFVGHCYVEWDDAFGGDQIRMSTSTNGSTWTAVARIPIDLVTSTVDHFIPGLAVDPLTSGSTAHLGLTYYFYPQSNCTQSNCRLAVGFISSLDGGTTWSAAKKVAGPMRLTWIADTDQGRMVGDYMSTSYVNGKAFGVFARGLLKNGSVFNEAMYTPATGLSAEVGLLF